MNLVPLRTAVVAGTCAIALSFVAVPAYAADAQTGSAAVASAQASQGGDDPMASEDPDPTPDDTATDGSNGDDATDDSGAMTDDGSDGSVDDTGDATPDPTDTTAPMPTEQGTPQHRLKDATLEPREVVKKGVRVEYRGLTPHAAYQPFYSTSESGGPIGAAVDADGKGRLSVVWHPASSLSSPFARPGAGYTIGLMGTTTQLTLVDEITVGYDSDLQWRPAKRHHGTVTLEVRADHSERTTTKDVAWKKVRVEFQKKVDDHWVTVSSKRTDDKGVAKATFVAGKNVWRAVLAAKGHIFGSTTGSHRK